MNIQADQKVPFRIVKRVMYSCGVAGYFNLNFAALDIGSGAAAAQLPRPVAAVARPESRTGQGAFRPSRFRRSHDAPRLRPRATSRISAGIHEISPEGNAQP